MKLSHPSFTRRHLTKAAALGSLALVSTASATLLVDPTGGEILASSSFGHADKDDGFAQTPHYLDAPFFGQSLLSPFPNISFNGYLYFGTGDSDGGSAPATFGVSDVTRISPLWTNLTLDATSQVIQNTGPIGLDGFTADYNAVTWMNMQGGLGNEGFSATFQAIYFNNAATINGISFAAGDIAFSYGDITNFDELADVIIGLDQGTGGSATLPGYEAMGGWAAIGTFPTGANEYVHFRPDGSGNYNVTIAPIPEPGTTAAALLGGMLLTGRRRR